MTKSDRRLSGGFNGHIQAVIWVFTCVVCFYLAIGFIRDETISRDSVAMIGVSLGALLMVTLGFCYDAGWDVTILEYFKKFWKFVCRVRKIRQTMRIKRELRAFILSEKRQSRNLVVSQKTKTPPSV